MGVNLGAFLGVLVSGWLGETYGWAWGFGAAGLGMLMGLIVFVAGKPALMGQGEPPDPVALKRRVAGVPLETLIYLTGIAGIAVVWFLIQATGAVQTLLLVGGAGLLLYVLWVASKMEREPRQRMYAILFLIALQPVFWSLFEQAGGSLNLYTDRYVDRGGVPASLFQSINAAYIVLLAPLFAIGWTWLGQRNLEPSAPAKFGLALMQQGLAFLVLVWGAHAVGVDVATPVTMIFLFYLLSTTGELCLSPVGLSAMNRLAPRQLASLIMGAWFFSTAGGQFLAGVIGAATAPDGGAMTKEGTLAVYSTIGWWTIGIGGAVLLVSPIVKRWMHLDTLKDDELPGHAELGEPQAAGLQPGGGV
jgi:POT family proton-dependent oligopeptide transporter